MIDKFSKLLENAPLDKSFKFDDGEIRSLAELRNVLIEKGKPFYDRFVNDAKNDFATWVKDVFQDKELAASLRKTKSYAETIKLIDNKLKFAELWLLFNEDKEKLVNYLLENYNQELYEPQYHLFETLENINNVFVNKSEEQKDMQERRTLEPPIFKGRDDLLKLKELEREIPGLLKQERKSFFTNFLNLFRK